jgi:hypothetical protein
MAPSLTINALRASAKNCNFRPSDLIIWCSHRRNAHHGRAIMMPGRRAPREALTQPLTRHITSINDLTNKEIETVF